MKCGKTNLCEVKQIGKKYAVTWNKHITGLSVYHEKAGILLDMIARDTKSIEVGIILSNSYVVWVSQSALYQMPITALKDYVARVGNINHADQIEGAVFDNMDDVESFTDNLEKKYIWYTLKQ